jgi:hypothetical protein
LVELQSKVMVTADEHAEIHLLQRYFSRHVPNLAKEKAQAHAIGAKNAIAESKPRSYVPHATPLMGGLTRAGENARSLCSRTRGACVMIMLWVCWMAIMLGAARVATDRDRTAHEKERH